MRLLRKEIFKAKGERDSVTERLSVSRDKLKQALPFILIPTVILHTRYDLRILRDKQVNKHNSINFKDCQWNKKGHYSTSKIR